jgi:hypothetical protein
MQLFSTMTCDIMLLLCLSCKRMAFRSSFVCCDKMMLMTVIRSNMDTGFRINICGSVNLPFDEMGWQ